jgi:hypothetical protein
MGASKERELLLSQMIDGELSPDEANQALSETLDELADVLDDAEACRRLRVMIQLRETLSPWRRQEPARPVVAIPASRSALRHSHLLRRFVDLAAAAALGGVLVAGGFYLGNRDRGREIAPTVATRIAPAATIVSPEQRQEIDRAFALHESVAGPLCWYASDDAAIQVAPALKGETLKKPIAVVLRLSADPNGPQREKYGAKTYVIVLRGDSPATIELPGSPLASNLHVRLLSTETNGRIDVQYAIAADAGKDRGLLDTSLAGRRSVGEGTTSLGQLAVNSHLVNVDASAWVMKNESKL